MFSSTKSANQTLGLVYMFYGTQLILGTEYFASWSWTTPCAKSSLASFAFQGQGVMFLAQGLGGFFSSESSAQSKNFLLMTFLNLLHVLAVPLGTWHGWIPSAWYLQIAVHVILTYVAYTAYIAGVVATQTAKKS
eukprot:m.553807 g.553807  ORF g.553807 m.553807 type:complete len:135 (-) comp22172_c1_seq16:2188-2592(-)